VVGLMGSIGSATATCGVNGKFSYLVPGEVGFSSWRFGARPARKLATGTGRTDRLWLVSCSYDVMDGAGLQLAGK
jgi:hypothetical protein